MNWRYFLLYKNLSVMERNVKISVGNIGMRCYCREPKPDYFGISWIGDGCCRFSRTYLGVNSQAGICCYGFEMLNLVD